MKLIENLDNRNLFFTADTHFFHSNIMKYCDRPFDNIQSMDREIIENWNDKVSKDSTIFILGDFAMTSRISRIKLLLSLLNGKKVLILGNHDYKNKYTRKEVIDLFEGNVFDTLTFEVKDDELESGRAKFFLSHYPHLFWPSTTLHLHGHMHYPHKDKYGMMELSYHSHRYDVGMDGNGYTPVSYEDLKVIFTKRMLNGK